jgi:hypothetical protein
VWQKGKNEVQAGLIQFTVSTRQPDNPTLANDLVPSGPGSFRFEPHPI